MPNKPTTLIEKFKKKFPGLYLVDSWEMQEGTQPYTAIYNFFTSHNKELLSKIEGMRKKVEWLETTDITKALTRGSQNFGYNQALDEVISLINQEK